MADPFLAEIRIFPFNFAPSGWAWCNGQLMPLAQNTALFSLLGTSYGGDGKTNFALPDLMGRAALGAGQGTGLTYRELGEADGSAAVALTPSEIPAHDHRLMASTSAGTNYAPDSTQIWGVTGGRGRPASERLYANSANTTMSEGALASAGGSVPHNNMQPYLTLYFCIALQGVFPPRT